MFARAVKIFVLSGSVCVNHSCNFAESHLAVVLVAYLYLQNCFVKDMDLCAADSLCIFDVLVFELVCYVTGSSYYGLKEQFCVCTL